MEELEEFDDNERLFNKGLQDKLDRYLSRKKKPRTKTARKKRAVSKKRISGGSSIKKRSVTKKRAKPKPRAKAKPKSALTEEMKNQRTELKTAKFKLLYLKHWGKLLFDSLKMEGQFTDSELIEFLVLCAAESPTFRAKMPIGTPVIQNGSYKLVKGVVGYAKAMLEDLTHNYCNCCRRTMYDCANRNSLENVRNQVQLHEAITLKKK